MQITPIKNIQEHVDNIITVGGWVKTRRDSKSGISFISINDGSGFAGLQIIAPNTLANYNDTVLKLTSGCAITATGTIVKSQGGNQAFEMQAQTINAIGLVAEPETYPIQAKRHTLEYLREVAHLRPRTNTIGAVTRVRNTISQTIHSTLNSEGFLWIHTPIITTNDCEGAGELFRVSTLDLANQKHQSFEDDFFGRETFLTVSGQLNVEAYCCAMTKVYTFGPTFRAENSNTSRHLAEFWMIEPEIAFADLDDVISLATKLIKAIAHNVVTNNKDDLEFFNKFIDKEVSQRIDMLINSEFARMTYTEAIDVLTKSSQKFEFPVAWGKDLQSEHERFICEQVTKKPTVITDYPKDIKSFYMRQNDDGKTVAAMDIIVPGIGEIVGGSQREERLDKLDQRLDEMQINKEDLNWYRDLRKYGSVPHAGFGLGLERLLGYVTGVSNVRDLIAFPRVPKSANY